MCHIVALYWEHLATTDQARPHSSWQQIRPLSLVCCFRLEWAKNGGSEAERDFLEAGLCNSIALRCGLAKVKRLLPARRSDSEAGIELSWRLGAGYVSVKRKRVDS